MPNRSESTPDRASTSPNPTGRRPRGPRHFASEDAAADFAGLPDTEAYYELGDLVKAAVNRGGWSPALVAHFTLLLKWTRPLDWTPGAQPIVWLSVGETADRLGISTSQVRRNEGALHRLGAVAWKDSPNHRRYGSRGPDGAIEEAWGINLAPAAALIPALRLLVQDAGEDRARWRHLRHAVAAARARILAAVATAQRDERLDAASAEAWRRLVREAAGSPAATLSQSALESRLHQLDHLDVVLQQDLAAPGGSSETPDPDDEEPADPSDMHAKAAEDACQGTHPCLPPSYYTTRDDSLRKDVARAGRREEGAVDESDLPPPPVPDTPPSAPVRAFLDILPDRIRDRLVHERPGWPGIVDAARDLAAELGISQHAWGVACQILGREDAAVALSIVAIKHEQGLIHSPGGYLRGMTDKGAAGELDLRATVFGLQDRKRRSFLPEAPRRGRGA